MIHQVGNPPSPQLPVEISIFDDGEVAVDLVVDPQC
jgi:hypothetical protein